MEQQTTQSDQRPAEVTPPPTQQAGAADAAAAPRRGAWRSFFGVGFRGQTWLNLAYLWLAFPLGLFYFIYFVTMLSVGLSLVIIWVGIPLLAFTAASWWLFAAFERYLADGLLRTELAPAPTPWRAGDRLWLRIKAHFSAAATWKDLAFLFVRFPLGILSFVVTVVSASITLSFLAIPALFRMSGFLDLNQAKGERGIYLEFWHIDTFAESLVFIPIGLLALIISLHVVNAVGWLSKVTAEGLLERAPLAPTSTPEGS